MAETETLVADLAARLAPLELTVAEAWWDASTDVSEQNDRRRVTADLAMRDVLADAQAFESVRDAFEGHVALGNDDHTSRQLRLLRDAFLPQQVPADMRTAIVELETSLDSTFNSYRGHIDGQRVDDNTIAKVLRTSDDTDERRQAWEAAKEVGAEVAESVLDLVRVRNRAARSLGFRDHFDLTLATSELDEGRLLRTLDEVEQVTAKPFAAWKAPLDDRLAARFGGTPDDLRPWHYDDPFFQEAPITGAIDLDPLLAHADLEALTIRTFEGIGLDVGPVLQRSDLLPRPGKSQHAFCIDIDRAGDVRVLSNNVPGERWASTMLHEFGHAVYDLEVERDLPWLLRTMHPLVTEGLAMLCGRLVREPEWLRTIAGVPASEVHELAEQLASARRAALLVFVRWALVMIHFERELYADPESDHDSRWWDLVERLQRVHRPDNRQAPDWAAKVHFAVAPVYYQHYLYGELVASQLEATLRQRAGGLVDRPAVGSFFRQELCGPGASLRWDHLLTTSTGEPLSARHLAAGLAP